MQHPNSIYRFLRRLVLAWAIAFAFGSSARAEEPVLRLPGDVPLLFPESAVDLPALPKEYVHATAGWLAYAYPPRARERVKPLLSDAEAIKRTLGEELGQPVLESVELRIARTPEEMAELAPKDAPPPAYASGVAYPRLHLVLLSLSAPRTYDAVDLPEVFRHELAHLALEDAVRGAHVPRWFNEGLAVYESGESRLSRVRTLWDATVSGTLLPLADLDRGFPDENSQVSIAYAESADFVRHLMRASDRGCFTALIARLGRGEPFDRALGDAYRTDLHKLEYEWRDGLSKHYTVTPLLASGSLIWVVAMAMLIVGWMKSRQHAKATLRRWQREEDALFGAKEPSTAPDVAPEIAARKVPDLPRIEHDGSWHTLH